MQRYALDRFVLGKGMSINGAVPTVTFAMAEQGRAAETEALRSSR